MTASVPAATDKVGLLGPLKVWHRQLFDEGTKYKLRLLTADLTQRIEHVFDRILGARSASGWESWLIEVCREPACSHALGIPPHYDRHDLGRLVAGGDGLAASQALALRKRVTTALNLSAKVFYHELCPESFQRFLPTFQQILASLNRNHDGVGTPNYVSVWQEVMSGQAARQSS